MCAKRFVICVFNCFNFLLSYLRLKHLFPKGLFLSERFKWKDCMEWRMHSLQTKSIRRIGGWEPASLLPLALGIHWCHCNGVSWEEYALTMEGMRALELHCMGGGGSGSRTVEGETMWKLHAARSWGNNAGDVAVDVWVLSLILQMMSVKHCCWLLVRWYSVCLVDCALYAFRP